MTPFEVSSRVSQKRSTEAVGAMGYKHFSSGDDRRGGSHDCLNNDVFDPFH